MPIEANTIYGCSGYRFVLKLLRLQNLEIGHLWVAGTVMAVFVFMNIQPISPHDFWWHMAVGREILATKAIPTVDEYSFTMANQLYPSYKMYWLPDVGLFSLYKLGGPALVVFVFSLIISLSYTFLIQLCFQVSGNCRVAAAATIIAIGFGRNNWNVRPQGISYLLGVLFLVGIYSYRRRPHYYWLLLFPAVMLVWTNCHGSFPVGLVMLSIWLAHEAWPFLLAKWQKKPLGSLRSLLAPGGALVLATLACLVCPNGIKVFSYVGVLTSNPTVQKLVEEWAPPTFSTQAGAIFIGGFLLSVTILILSPKRPNFFQIATFLSFGILGFKMVRGGVWFGLAMAPILADHLAAIADNIWLGDRRPDRPQEKSPIINLLFLAVFAVVAFMSMPWFKHVLPLPKKNYSLISSVTPTDATDFLMATRPPGRLFHEMYFGSYLIWAAQPTYKVFVDPRIELYRKEIWEDYLIISNALPGWESRLESYGVQTLMLSPENQTKLIRAATSSLGWRKIYEDSVTVIFVKGHLGSPIERPLEPLAK